MLYRCPLYLNFSGMRGARVIGLVGILLIPFVITQGWYGWERHRLHQHVRARLFAGLPDSALVCLRFSVYDSRTFLRWERDDEFVLDGQWYDVARRVQQGDTLLLWCLPDHAETALEKAQRQQVTEALAHHTPLRDTLQRLFRFFLGFFWEKTEMLPIAGNFWNQQKPEVPKEQNHAQAYHTPPSPPPEGKAAYGQC